MRVRDSVPLTSHTACGVSLCTMTAISVDRFLAPTIMTSSRASLTSVVICLIISLLSAIYFWNRTVYFILTAIIICISLLISTVSYIIIYRIVRRHQLQIFAQQRATKSSNNSPNANLTQIKKSALNTFVFYVAMILCYLPMVISLSLYSLSFDDWPKALNFADVAVMLNSSINPFLYCWRLPCLRRAVVKMGRKLIICRGSEELNQFNNFALA